MKFKILNETSYGDLRNRQKEHRKKQKGLSPFMNYSQGNIEYNNSVFNNSFGGDCQNGSCEQLDSNMASSSIIEKTGNSLQLGEDTQQKRYRYNGWVTRFNRWVGDVDIYTTASSIKQARQNIMKQIKDQLNLAADRKIEIDNQKIEEISQKTNYSNPVVNDPKFNYDDPDRPSNYKVENYRKGN